MSRNNENKEQQAVIRQMKIENPLGFHARPATIFARAASEFDSEITIEKDGTSVSAKSLIGLLGLGAGRGTQIKIVAEGSDAREAVDKLEQLIKSRFDEP